MSDIEASVSFPLDDEGFFRRECPFCRNEFKVLLTKEELGSLAQEGIDSFMIEPQEKVNSKEDVQGETGYFCPYCGQRAPEDSWWTQEQLAYVNMFAKNIIASIVDKNLIGPLKANFGHRSSGPISTSFKGREMEQPEPWISPEVNDMDAFDLPCCHRKIKVQDSKTLCIHCFFCGFPHERH
jgi:hypothetical protein